MQIIDGITYLEGDGSYPDMLIAILDPDLKNFDAQATWFGGDSDPDDNGETASGVVTKGNPTRRGVSLPMAGFGGVTAGSPIPKLPWFITVRIFNYDNGNVVEAPLIDIGPAPPPKANAEIDLTQQTFLDLGGDLQAGVLPHLAYRILGGAQYVQLPAQPDADNQAAQQQQ